MQKTVTSLSRNSLQIRRLLVYGGVLLSKYKNEVVPAEVRESANATLKEKIAAQAAERIKDGDTVFFDSSSTVRRMCKHIKKRKNLKIITNNLRICREFRDSEVTVFCTGGEFYKQRDCFLGPTAERFLKTVRADSMFFSCKGLSEKPLAGTSAGNLQCLHQGRKALLSAAVIK